MTEQQLERWRDFALRMARTAYRNARRPDAKWIEDVVQDFFDRLHEMAIPCIVSWDDSTPYPVGNPCHDRDTQLSWCGCDGYRAAHDNHSNPECEECQGDGLHRALVSPDCVGDMMTDFLDEYCPGSSDCSDTDVLLFEQWDEQWGGPVRCCIRAGLDCACASSGGVLGFTVGDVRRMYPGGVPAWVFPPDERLHYWPSGELDGMFSELPDSVGVVL